MKLKDLSDAHAAVIAALLAVLAAAVTYACTEQAKLNADSYQRREERYQQLTASVTAFYITSTDLTKRRQFLAELDRCWLYCSDDVLRACYQFVDSIKEGNKASDEDRRLLLGAFVVAMRKDLVSHKRVKQSSMKPDEYQSLYVTPAASQ